MKGNHRRITIHLLVVGHYIAEAITQLGSFWWLTIQRIYQSKWIQLKAIQRMVAIWEPIRGVMSGVSGLTVTIPG